MSWKNELKQAIRSVPDLLKACGLDAALVAVDASPDFSIFVPPRWLSLIEPNAPDDPLLRQVLADRQEREEASGDLEDPVGDHQSRVLDGVLHKYAHRILLLASSACPIHCRYCFRRYFPYQDYTLTHEAWQATLAYVQTHEIKEVILSGGDPLMLSNERLARLCRDLYALPTVRRIRIHTRFPTTIPARFEAAFWDAILPYASKLIWVWHVNHPRELGEEVAKIADYLHRQGMRVLAQTVLLRGVNDSVEVLEDLMWALDAMNIQPYYLHALDRVRGAAHYEVAQDEARGWVEALRARLPGYLVPKWVQERPGAASKTPLA